MKNEYLNGLAEKNGVTAKDVDPKQLAMGMEVEMEHTDNKKVSKTIALDHLTEFPKYYSGLKHMEELFKDLGLGHEKKSSLDAGTTPVIIATETPRISHEGNILKPLSRIAKFMNARSKVGFFKKLIYGEARDLAQEAINKNSYLNSVAAYAFNDELEKIAVSPEYLMSKVPVVSRVLMGSGTKKLVSDAMVSGNKRSAMNILNSEVGGKVRPRMSMVPRESFRTPVSSEVGEYVRPGQGAIPQAKFSTRQVPEFNTTASTMIK